MRRFGTNWLLASVAVAPLLLAKYSCGPKGSSGDLSSSSNATALQKITIPISLSQSTSNMNALNLNSLSLAAPGGVSVDSFVMTLANCTSGLSGTNSSQTVMNVYLNDTNCLAKLTSFVLHSQSYIPSGTGSSPFTTWLAGDTAIFRGASNTDLINVKVVSQLSSPILTPDVISYEFTILKSGTNSASITVSNALSIYTAGQDAPNFQINSGGGLLTGLVSSGGSAGAGIFTFQLICSVSAMTVGANPSYNSFCPTVTPGGTIAGGASGVDIGNASAFSYKLIADPNNAPSGGTLTLAQAIAAFVAGGDTTVTLGAGVITSGSTGFNTVALTGPGPIASNQKMILILQAKNTNPTYSSNPNYSSFQYFPITLPTVNP